MKLVLHACCGPCLLEPYDALSADDDVLVVYAQNARDGILHLGAFEGFRLARDIELEAHCQRLLALAPLGLFVERLRGRADSQVGQHEEHD